MANAALVYENLSDAATLSASSSVALAPVTNLQNGHVARVWAGTTTSPASDSIFIDFGTATDWDALLLAGLNLTLTGSVRVRTSNTDATCTTGVIYDSTTLVGAVDPQYGTYILLLSQESPPTPARYARIDLIDSAITRIEAGRLLIGNRAQVNINYDPGQARTAINASPRTIGVYGQTFIDRRPGYFVIEVTFNWLTEAERNGFIEDIELAVVNDGHVDLLLILDPASTKLPRDSIFGYIDSDQPVIEPQVVFPRAFSKSYRIRQRL